jgi:hypothetical protein
VSTARWLGWSGLVGGLLAQCGAYLMAMVLAPEAAPVAWLAVVGIAASLSGTLVIGALRDGQLSRPALLAAIVLFFVPLIGFGAALLLPPETANGPLLLDLPRRAAVVLLGVGVLPLLILPFAYANDPNNAPLDAGALMELRAEAERLRRTGPV